MCKGLFIGCFETKSNFKKIKFLGFNAIISKLGGRKHPGYLIKEKSIQRAKAWSLSEGSCISTSQPAKSQNYA